jgi:hypothetical protein
MKGTNRHRGNRSCNVTHEHFLPHYAFNNHAAALGATRALRYQPQRFVTVALLNRMPHIACPKSAHSGHAVDEMVA